MSIPPQLDKRRIAAGVTQTNTAHERRRAARHAASNAHNAADLAQLLDMLGLSTHDAHTEVTE